MLPILYSFRRCPYAMRARLALCAAAVTVELREVALRDKPADMLAASPKGSVPVLILADGRVIDESWDIIQWALHQHDPDCWLGKNDSHVAAATALILENDTTFKLHLDHYKYPDHYPEQPRSYHRAQAEVFLQKLENKLRATRYLLGDGISIADAGIFPFIRQFAEVDKDWFAQTPYVALRNWLESWLRSELFAASMKKYPVWQPGAVPVTL